MASLPDYMMPSAFMLLESLPLTPNGKLDRKALPRPAADPARVGSSRHRPAHVDRVRPRRDLEPGPWIDAVGIHDNFFELGGHSLLATQVIYRINNAFPIKLPLRRLFEPPRWPVWRKPSTALRLGEVRESIRPLKPGNPGAGALPGARRPG